MQSTPQRTVGVLWTYLLFTITFWTVLWNRIIVFLNEKLVLKKSIAINTNIIHKIYSNVVFLAKWQPYSIQSCRPD